MSVRHSECMTGSENACARILSSCSCLSTNSKHYGLLLGVRMHGLNIGNRRWQKYTEVVSECTIGGGVGRKVEILYTMAALVGKVVDCSSLCHQRTHGRLSFSVQSVRFGDLLLEFSFLLMYAFPWVLFTIP